MNVCIIVLMCAAVAFAALTQRNKAPIDELNTESGSFAYYAESKWCFIISFLILATILFLSKSGADLPGYLIGYENWGIDKLKDVTTEWGYTLLILFLKSIVKDPYVGLGIIKVLSLLLFYTAAYKLRDRINLGMAVLAYCCLLYIYAFHLLRMMLAIGIVFLALAYEVQERSTKCVILLIMAFFFHYTSILVLAAYILAKLCRNKLNIIKMIIILVVSFFVLLSINVILQTLTSNISFFAKYTGYLNNTDFGGFGLVLIYLPVLFLIVYFNQNECNDRFYILFSIMGIMLFVCSLAGFFLPITRLNYYFYSFFYFYVSAFSLKNERYYFKIGEHKFGVMTMFMVVYYIYSFISYINSGGLDSNGLIVYKFIWSY